MGLESITALKRCIALKWNVFVDGEAKIMVCASFCVMCEREREGGGWKGERKRRAFVRLFVGTETADKGLSLSEDCFVL